MDKFALKCLIEWLGEIRSLTLFLTQQLLLIWDIVSQGTQIFQKSRFDVMFLWAIVVTSSKFHAEGHKY